MAAPAWTHFVLQSPPSLGFSDEKEPQAPCGGFDPATVRDTVTAWPVSGHPVSLTSTHSMATWVFRAATLTNPTVFMDMQPNISQSGLGNMCFTVTAPPSLAGQQGIVQVVQAGMMGMDPNMPGMTGMDHMMGEMLYQCAAVRFTNDAPAAMTRDCTNSSTVKADLMPIMAGSLLNKWGTSGKEGSNSTASPSGKSAGSKGFAVGNWLGLVGVTALVAFV
ncbi:uncharacterized protein BCR38DRAFT_337696 [Pseudomassariella vexata]|uniref:Copper acquisition factor BIM1-like domain-containing protein n=1 Tax=Pseudomassariella vexata TaxID=1141098 RepID=A0A1Y2E9H9_9PEZI|nr:uncharacterized protein BCR38DRAFT_337696 [Pseudomassariella vexata]ORY67515.1 hypothetical protein BCR38DRAFT_337696 [Pseudomassariella vexata]